MADKLIHLVDIATEDQVAVKYLDNGDGTYSLSTSTSGSIAATSNIEVSLLASAAHTTTQQSADQSNLSGNSVLVFLNITVASGTGGLTLRILGKDPVSGNYYLLNAAPTAILATGQYGYLLGPGCVSSGGSIAQTTAGILPKTWAIEVVHGDASSYTYSVGAGVN